MAEVGYRHLCVDCEGVWRQGWGGVQASMCRLAFSDVAIKIGSISFDSISHLYRPY